jgi:hypothetical protein
MKVFCCFGTSEATNQKAEPVPVKQSPAAVVTVKAAAMTSKKVLPKHLLLLLL